MALRFMDGFDHYASANGAEKWTSVATFVIGSTSPTPRNGAGRLALSSVSNALFTNPGGAQTQGVALMGWRTAVFQAGIMDVRDASVTHLTFMVNATGNIEVRRGSTIGTLLATSANALSVNTWYHLRLKWTIDDATGVVEVAVNGTTTGWINITGQDTRNAGNASFNGFRLMGLSTTSYYDDVVFLDGDTSDVANDLTDILTDTKVVTVIASAGDGALADFTPSAGADNGAMVDDATPNGDTDYNASATVDHRDSYAFAALGTTGTVHGVQLSNSLSKTDAGARTTRNLTRIGGVNYEGADFSPSTSTYAYARTVWTENPATSAPWNISEIDAAEFGVKVQA